MDRGFVILAQNTRNVNYVKCAEALALSIRNVMPNERVSIITDNTVDKSLFDKVIPLPHGDQDPDGDWKLNNDWQVYDASPYEYTIKLEADMYLPCSVEYWWDILKDRDVVVSTHVRNFKQEISGVLAYRKFIADNKLPNCYNAITYFRKSPFARTFFEVVRDVFENWEEYRKELICKIDEPATTDWVYAIACHVLGVENTTLPLCTDTAFGMVHMKQFINDLPTEDWTDTLVYEILPHTFRINTIPQMYPVHYHIKSFADKIMERTR